MKGPQAAELDFAGIDDIISNEVKEAVDEGPAEFERDFKLF